MLIMLPMRSLEQQNSGAGFEKRPAQCRQKLECFEKESMKW